MLRMLSYQQNEITSFTIYIGKRFNIKTVYNIEKVCLLYISNIQEVYLVSHTLNVLHTMYVCVNIFSFNFALVFTQSIDCNCEDHQTHLSQQRLCSLP